MCGIAGAVGFVDDRIASAVARANAAQRHRGPDGEGIWRSHATPAEFGVVLAHRRLAILDLSEAGAQPMHDHATGNVIVFNGEVYNHGELRRELEAAGRAFRSTCDTETLLYALHHWGEAAISKCNGMFALALWEPGRGTLRLVRDRVGIKPLYYAWTEDRRTLLFASELRALLATGLIARRIDPAALRSYLWNGFVVGPNTMIEGVRLLPAGTHATVTASLEVTPRPYWQLPASKAEPTTAADVKDALHDAVKRRLIADVPLGVFLSGGIDSSAVSAMAMKAADAPVHTFNIGFEEAQYDESPHAEAVAAALGTEHRRIVLTESDFRAHLDDALDAIDQPTFDAINTYFVSRAVREAGLTVALAGTGGDELFGGYTSFVDLPRAQAWAKRLNLLPPTMRRWAVRSLAKWKSHAGDVPDQTRWGKLDDVAATGGDLAKLYQVSYSLYTRAFLAELTAVETVDYGHPDLVSLAALAEGSTPLHAISLMELSQFIGQRLLRDTDAASMAVALEVRVPLLDYHVIEALAGLDDAARFQPLGRKRLLRELGMGELDPALFDRPKSGFVLPIDAWCRRSLQAQITEAFDDAAACEAVGLNPQAVQRLWLAFQSGSPGIYWSRVWALYVLIRWRRNHDAHL